MQLNQSNTRKADQTIFEFQLQTTVMASLHPQIHMIFTTYNGPTSKLIKLCAEHFAVMTQANCDVLGLIYFYRFC